MTSNENTSKENTFFFVKKQVFLAAACIRVPLKERFPYEMSMSK